MKCYVMDGQVRIILSQSANFCALEQCYSIIDSAD